MEDLLYGEGTVTDDITRQRACGQLGNPLGIRIEVKAHQYNTYKLLKNVQANDESGDANDSDHDLQGGRESSKPRWDILGQLSQQLLDLGDDCRHGWMRWRWYKGGRKNELNRCERHERWFDEENTMVRAVRWNDILFWVPEKKKKNKSAPDFLHHLFYFVYENVCTHA